MSKTSITISSKHCERACIQAIKTIKENKDKEWEKAIQEQMTKKPWLWVFDKPAKTREEALTNISRDNPWFGFFYEHRLAELLDLLEMCSVSDEITLSQKDFNMIKAYMR